MGTCGPCMVELASLASRAHRSSTSFSTRCPHPCAPQDVALDYIGKRGSTIGATKETRVQYARELLQVTAAVLCGAGLDSAECAVTAVKPVTSRLRPDGLVVCPNFDAWWLRLLTVLPGPSSATPSRAPAAITAPGLPQKELLPHIGMEEFCETKKAYFFGYVVHRLLLVALGRREVGTVEHAGSHDWSLLTRTQHP